MSSSVTDIKYVDITDGIATVNVDVANKIYMLAVNDDILIQIDIPELFSNQVLTFELLINYTSGMITWPNSLNWLNQFNLDPGKIYVVNFRKYGFGPWVAHYSHKLGD